MKKLTPTPYKAIFIFILSISIPSIAHTQDIPTTAYKNSVVAIFSKAAMDNGKSENSSGSGFVISKDGYILTALHVIGDPALYKKIELDVYFPVNQDRSWSFKGPYVGTVISTLPLYDLALIRLQDSSFLSTVPILALGFSKSIDEDAEYKGYGYNMLRSPADRTPPFLIDASYSAPVSDLPFDVFQETSFNFGASGGPLLQRSSNYIVAIWHGRIAKFTAMDKQEKSVNGLSWVIPMDMSVKDWLRSNNVSLAASPPKSEEPIYTNGIAKLNVNAGSISNPPLTASNKYVSAPLGSEIVSADLELKKQELQCKKVNSITTCDTVTINKTKPLDVNSGRIVYINEPIDASTRINLTLKRNDNFYSNLDFQSVEFEAPAGPIETSQQLVSFKPEHGKELIAASVTLDTRQSSIKTDIQKGSFAISKSSESRTGITKIIYDTFGNPEATDTENKTSKGTATLVIGNTGVNINNDDFKQVFDSVADKPLQGQKAIYKTKIITP